ncbi:hypothetical protein BO70DRAFT_394487 [Aspergillus heteromorphus CBS 117.55]|uniref:Uncharacterized protein n=1 Tax=Aspergillus heteromorphus CBS 117.55 TaxID=1448321 RepID=A0A317WNN5_9EURO|nr:uncharacterized protein BO70DRAFT_394487 [Aspergillus heteromorphus CBS 117.55]PWY87605.1 hypothetical protein BO70DRAFT_394487 [Aspergillus heteromorphus CBS 117.55]
MKLYLITLLNLSVAYLATASPLTIQIVGEHSEFALRCSHVSLALSSGKRRDTEPIKTLLKLAAPVMDVSNPRGYAAGAKGVHGAVKSICLSASRTRLVVSGDIQQQQQAIDGRYH